MKKIMVSLGVTATLLVGVLTIDSVNMANQQGPVIQVDPELGDLD